MVLVTTLMLWRQLTSSPSTRPWLPHGTAPLPADAEVDAEDVACHELSISLLDDQYNWMADGANVYESA